MHKQSLKELEPIWEKQKRQPVNRKEMERRKALREKKRKRALRIRCLILTGMAVCVILMILGLIRIGGMIWKWVSEEKNQSSQTAVYISRETHTQIKVPKPEMTADFLTPNAYSRPQEQLETIEEIYVHYTANPGTSAAQNRSYFENLGITGETSASAHFVIGYEGEIIQCLPLDEIGYAVAEHNYSSVSIECCYLNEDGSFTDATYQSLVQLTGWLLREYELDLSAIKRHYDASGKMCPLYFVENEDAWKIFLKDVDTYLKEESV